MRACVRVVLLANLCGASFAGCDTLDSLREIPNALFVSGKHPVEPDNVSFEGSDAGANSGRGRDK